MKAAVYYSNTDIRIDSRPVPAIGDDEILVEMAASGICGTDTMEWYRKRKGPRVLGHEMAGVVATSNSTAFPEGSRVFVSHHVPCYQCRYCRAGNHTACETLHTGNYDPGGFSEYIRIPAINVKHGTFVIPDNMSFDTATLIEPLACALRAQEICNIDKDKRVLVMGSGFSGLLNIQLAAATGAECMAVDPDSLRRKLACQFGAARCYAPDELPGTFKADVVIMCTGAQSAFEQAFYHVDRKGLVLLFAIPQNDLSLPVVDFWRNEWSLISSYGAAPKDLDASLQVLKQMPDVYGPLITGHFPLEEIQNAFAAATSGGAQLKVLIHP